MPQNIVSVHRTWFFLMSLENWANVLNLAFRSNYCSLHAFWHILCLKGKTWSKIAILVRNFCFGQCIENLPRRQKCHIIHYLSPFLLFASRFSLFLLLYLQSWVILVLVKILHFAMVFDIFCAVKAKNLQNQRLWW